MASYAWTVIGAGPAGIAAVGRLLDHGIADDKIAWIDPAFAAGDLGRRWRSVSSNTIAGTFMELMDGSAAFRFSEAPPLPLREVDPERDVRPRLGRRSIGVGHRAAVRASATHLKRGECSILEGRQWRIKPRTQELSSKK